MKKALANLTIGKKLAGMSVLGIIFVLVMVGVCYFDTTAVHGAARNAMRNSIIAQTMIDAEQAMNGMQLGSREILLATTVKQVDEASGLTRDYYTEARGHVAEARLQMRDPKRQAVADSVNMALDDFYATINSIEKLHRQSVTSGSLHEPDWNTLKSRMDTSAEAVASLLNRVTDEAIATMKSEQTRLNGLLASCRAPTI